MYIFVLYVYKVYKLRLQIADNDEHFGCSETLHYFLTQHMFTCITIVCVCVLELIWNLFATFSSVMQHRK